MAVIHHVTAIALNMSMHVETQRVEVSLELADVTCEVNIAVELNYNSINSIVTAFR